MREKFEFTGDDCVSGRSWARRLQQLLIAIVLLTTLSGAVWAQGSLGGITGSITDTSGAAVPKATVLLTNLDTGVAATVSTSGDGIYRVSLPSGRYRLTASSPGFKTFAQEPIIISTATVATSRGTSAASRRCDRESMVEIY